jgi:hypothetical protein
LQGVSSLRVPETIVSLRKPLTITGLEIRVPFEYSRSANVHSFGVKKGESHPLGGVLTAERIGYGEREADDATTVPQWSVSGLWANAVSSADTTEVVIRSCRAYDGELTGTVTLSTGKKGLDVSGDLRLQDLDLERLVKGLGVKKEKFYVNGLMEGEITVSGKEGGWDEISTELSAVPPGGIIRIENVEKLLDSVPGEAGKATLDALKGGLGPDQWKSFKEAMKEFRYSEATVNVIYRPFQARLGPGLRARLELHLVGKGAGYPFDITIPVTWDVI